MPLTRRGRRSAALSLLASLLLTAAPAATAHAATPPSPTAVPATSAAGTPRLAEVTGVTRVTGVTGGAGGAEAAAAAVCNKQCDGRDPAAATSDRVPVSSALYGRSVRLHLSDNDVMGWASIENGAAGDEVWLDRSYDGGRTWAAGSRLGATSVPTGSSGWRTGMYNVDDWNTAGVGALRACGKAGDRPEITCTGWARVNWNAWSRSTAAATALMMSYDRNTGLYGGNGWWTSANALTAVLDNARLTGMPSYRYAIASTYDKNLGAQGGSFRNDYLDDTGWWGLAWVAAYDATGDSRYLNTARADADHMQAYWNGTCGGGVLWNRTMTYKNAITNELFLQLNAALHNRIPGDTVYLGRAKAEWAWFQKSGMINGDRLINDGLTDSCANNGQPTWTYNQGVVLGGLTELYRATGDSALLATARTLAGASTVRLQTDGVLREPGEGDECAGDGPSFKGAYVRGLGRLDAQLADHPYAATLDRWADAAYARDRNALDQYGPHWNGGTGATDYGCQQSVLDLLNAAGQ
ncbi:glycoside hydrolase family 76 protein [Streptomyces sp. AM 2-1-1]|uniref:glycoside hydrolase family 76 protein n=1 Tax=Streptomyces sp. AM 2-1-1 TaxID=3028709 RepID=UPI0023B8E563|nr:glycoside hydrolase family 76 protein [Streptomyces sp. AM 2-1-1]WEH40963.1 glycoside hydrolase family 76 protein [Streptomyces sp. AM 2-1-1]